MRINEITVDEKIYFYKFTKANCLPIYGSGKYSNPGKNRPGKWHPKVTDLRICDSGYHVCDVKHIFPYLNQELYIVEVRGNHIEGDDKYSFEEMRFIRRVDAWNEKTMRLFACDCVEHVLHLFEAKYPKDKRPRNAIEITRKWIRGEVDAAAWAAAGAAAEDAAGAAAWDAARAAAGAAARAAAWAAAGAAARNAAWTAAWAAAGAAEHDWQVHRFLQYINGEAD